MASTNHTANYELSQFTQTDKPAWLGDYNQDMSKIDLGMKANADDIDTVESSVTDLAGTVTSMQASVTSNTNDIVDLKSTTATHTTEITNLQNENQTQQTQIERIAQIFTLSTTQQSASSLLSGKIVGGGIGGALTLAQSPDSSLFKMYGNLNFNSSASGESVQLTAVPGLADNYGLKTSLKLTNAPASAYAVSNSGFLIRKTGTTINQVDPIWFCVGTDGYIYVMTSYMSQTWSVGGPYTWTFTFNAQLYINADLGDINQ